MTYFTSEEVAKRYGVKVVTVWRWIKKGLLEASKMGGKFYRISEAALLAFERGEKNEQNYRG